MQGTVRSTSATLVGRDDELTAAHHALATTPEGEPLVVLVSGPAGIGKTRFLDALSARARDDDFRVIAGPCLDVAAGTTPYAPLIAAFRNAHPPAVDVLDALTGAVQMRRSRLFELLRTTMVGLARRVPTLLVVEDLQWSDRSTRDALLYLTSMARQGRWALAASYRDDDVRARPVLDDYVSTLGRDAVARLTLGPLTADAVAAQVNGITGQFPGPELGERVYRLSGGIPLLVEEVVAARAAGVAGVPEHLRDPLLARVRGLGRAVQEVVEVVAVVADDCDEQLVSRVLDAAPESVTAKLAGATDAGVLTRGRDGFRMRHDLLRQAVYDVLPPARRRGLHARVAEVQAGALPPDVAAVAHHWHEAGSAERSVPANLEAADLARRLHSPGNERAHLERVLSDWDAAPPWVLRAAGERADVLMRASAAAELEGSFQRAASWAEEATTLPDIGPGERASFLERLMIHRWRSGDGPGAQTAFDAALATLPDDADPCVRARVLAGCAWFCFVSYQPEAANRLSEAALRAGDRCGGDTERCDALIAWGAARPAAGLASLREARDLAVRLDASDELARAHLALDLSLRRLGRNHEAVTAVREGMRYVAAHGMARSFEAALMYELVDGLISVGEWDEAAEVLADMGGRALRGVPALFAAAFRARLAAFRGDDRTVQDAARQTLELARSIPQQQSPAVVALLALAERALWHQDPVDARDHVARAAELVSEPVLSAAVSAVAARVDADLSTSGSAPADAGAWPVRGDDDPSPVVRACAATARAEGSRRTRDPEPWRVAACAWETADDPYQVAYCRWRLGYALLRLRSGRPEAAAVLDVGLRAAVELRAEPLRLAIAGVAATARLRLRSASGDGSARDGFGLTGREREILPLLVAGRTNAQIADALVISPRTVGIHVSRILQKLGARTRTEAADVARRSGITSGGPEK